MPKWDIAHDAHHCPEPSPRQHMYIGQYVEDLGPQSRWPVSYEDRLHGSLLSLASQGWLCMSPMYFILMYLSA